MAHAQLHAPSLHDAMVVTTVNAARDIGRVYVGIMRQWILWDTHTDCSKTYQNCSESGAKYDQIFTVCLRGVQRLYSSEDCIPHAYYYPKCHACSGVCISLSQTLQPWLCFCFCNCRVHCKAVLSCCIQLSVFFSVSKGCIICTCVS